MSSILKPTESEYKKSCDDTQLYELINHINDLNTRTSKEHDEHGESIGSKGESESHSEATTEDDDYEENFNNNQTENNTNNSNTSQFVSRIPVGKLVMSNNNNAKVLKTNIATTKIPRIAKIPVRQSTNLTSLPVDLTSSSVSSVSLADTDENTQKSKLVTPSRTPRSFLRTPGLNNNNNSNNIQSDNNQQVLQDKKAVNKRGQSHSAIASSPSSSRSLSIVSEANSLLNDQSLFGDGKKTVRYIIRHKPRESQVVKIFSQKLELKNVASKINSLEKAATYQPSGGNVVIETKKLNWNAQAKIGSLEKAANYQPSGGNKKIEIQKLNWNAQSKIGSLEKANYKPGGGNIKIETLKLNFKEKAKPRTDTGLIIIETSSPSSFLSRSQAVSTEQIQSF